MSDYLQVAKEAARSAGRLLRDNFETNLGVNEFAQHDIKLELDVRSQELITKRILESFPDHAIYGEEGLTGNQAGEFQWVVDPIDGTVNYFYGIPHFCVSIAMRRGGQMQVGVIYDPMMDELFEVERGGPALRNGAPIAVSARDQLGDAIVTVGFSKTAGAIERGLARYARLARAVRKTRMLGSAALGMAYVACGRLDAYIEEEISLWDIAAGWLLVESAGGVVELTAHPGEEDKLSIAASNGRIPLV